MEHNLRYKKHRAQDNNTDQKLKKCAALLAESDTLMQEIADALGWYGVHLFTLLKKVCGILPDKPLACVYLLLLRNLPGVVL